MEQERITEKSPNPPHIIGAPDREPPEATKARLYQYHKENGTLGAFYDLYERER